LEVCLLIVLNIEDTVFFVVCIHTAKAEFTVTAVKHIFAGSTIVGMYRILTFITVHGISASITISTIAVCMSIDIIIASKRERRIITIFCPGGAGTHVTIFRVHSIITIIAIF